MSSAKSGVVVLGNEKLTETSPVIPFELRVPKPPLRPKLKRVPKIRTRPVRRDLMHTNGHAARDEPITDDPASLGYTPWERPRAGRAEAQGLFDDCGKVGQTCGRLREDVGLSGEGGADL